MAQFCPTCGNTLTEGMRFCSKCGTRIEPANTVQLNPDDAPQPAKTILLPSEETPPAAKPEDLAPTAILQPFEQPDSPATPSDNTPSASDKPNAFGSQASWQIPSTPESDQTKQSAWQIPSTPDANQASWQTPGVPPIPPTGTGPTIQGKKSNGCVWAIVAVLGLLLVLCCGGLAVGGNYISKLSPEELEDWLNEIAEITPVATSVVPSTPRSDIGLPSTDAPSSDGTGSIVFADNFNSENDSGFYSSDDDVSTHSFVNGTFEIALHEADYLVWEMIPDRITLDNMTAKVDATFTDGADEAAAGIMFHYQDADNFYMFSVSPDGTYALDLLVDNEWQQLIEWTDTPHIKGPNQVNQIGVTTNNGLIQLYINNTLVDTYSDDTFTYGEVAISVSTFSNGGATFRFDNLEIRE